MSLWLGAFPLQQVPARSSAAAPVSGVWQAQRVNAKPLPMTDEVIGRDGLTHAIRLYGMTLRLRPNGQFQAALMYKQSILTKGEKIDAQAILNDTWAGTYSVTGNHYHFDPKPQKGQQKVDPFDGDMSGRRITVAFDYEIVRRQHYVLDLDRNENMY